MENGKIERHRGRPPKHASGPGVPISLRLEPNVLKALRETGPGWQTRLVAFISKAVARKDSELFP